jgi:Translocation protein Sec62
MPPTKQEFEEKGYYTWLYEGPQALSNFMTFMIIAGFLAITCFPIWPHFLKVCVTLLLLPRPCLSFLTPIPPKTDDDDDIIYSF